MKDLDEKHVRNTKFSRPWYPKAQAEEQNTKNKFRFSAKLHEEARRIVRLAEEVYNCKGTFINYRMKFIAVKIENPRRKSQQQQQETFFTEILEESCHEKVVYDQGFIVRIYP